MVINTDRQASLRNAYYASLALLAILLAGSIVWYKQRMLFADPAYIFFRILTEKQLSIQEYRYGSAVTQVWPLLGGMMRLPLRMLLILYSASFYFFYCIVALLLGRWKQYALGILFAFYMSLLVSDVYFWPNNEVHQGMGWLMLFLGLFFRYQEQEHIPLWTHPVMLGCLFLALFSHFIVVVPCTFLWLYWVLYHPSFWPTRTQRIRIGCYSIAIVIIFLIKLQLGIHGAYDGDKLGAALNVKPKEIFESFHNSSAQTIGSLILRNYWLLIPITIVGLAAIIRLKQWGRVAVMLCFALGYFSLVCLTFPNTFARRELFYMESEWMAWAILLATPFVVHSLPALRPRLALMVVSLIYLVRLGYISQSFSLFNERVNRLTTITESLHERGITKAFLVAEQSTRDSAFLMDWSLAYESILLSSLKGDAPAVTFMVIPSDYAVPQPNKDLYLSPYLNLPAQQLDNRYFSIDTTKSYQDVPLAEVLH